LTFLRQVISDDGKDFDKAKYYPEDEKVLLEFDEKFQHHEVFANKY
jgi:hypothetical protein